MVFSMITLLLLCLGYPTALEDEDSIDWAPTVNLGYQQGKPTTDSARLRQERMQSRRAVASLDLSKSSHSPEMIPDLGEDSMTQDNLSDLGEGSHRQTEGKLNNAEQLCHFVTLLASKYLPH